MRSFVLRALLFALPVFVVLVALEVFLRRIPNDYSYKRSFWEHRPNDIHVLVLGSSHGYYDVDPACFRDKGFNAAHISQSIDLDHLLLQTYADRLDSLSVVVVPISYSTLFGRLSTGLEKWRVKNYAIYYGLPVSHWPGDHLELVQGTFRGQMERLKKYVFEGHDDRTCSDLGFGIHEARKKRADLTATGLDAAERHTKKDRSLFPSNMAHLHAIIALAERKHAQVLLLTLPAYRTYREHLDADQLQRTREAAQSLVRPGEVSYHDLLDSPAFDSTDFHDADHLNGQGAHKLSLMLDSLMRAERPVALPR